MKSFFIRVYPSIGSEIINRRIASYSEKVVDVGILQLRVEGATMRGCEGTTDRPCDVSTSYLLDIGLISRWDKTNSSASSLLRSLSQKI